jgi:hypothetical protein
MKTHLVFARAGLVLLLLCGGVLARADITVRLSVKFILNTNGAYPSGGIGTNDGFQVEVDRGNSILAATGRGYKLQVVEYLAIQPPPPDGQPLNYWFTNAARSNRRALEAASIADPVSWQRNEAGALNLYVNNSSSGSCSFIGTGDSISLGQSISIGTVLHEIGHFFDLSHTHAGDPSCTNPPPYAVGDGDGLSETIPDHNCLTQDGLSVANFGANYSSLNASQQASVDDTWFNVMSYHQEDRLIGIQMDYWGANANYARNSVCSGRTWFLATDGFDTFRDGLSTGQAFATVEWGLANVTAPDDILLLQTGNYTAPAAITTPCTLRAKDGPVTLTR